jgi:uracil phosphoribosyltransferase
MNAPMLAASHFVGTAIGQVTWRSPIISKFPRIWRDVLIVDRVLVAANSAVAAVDRLKEVNPKFIKFLSLLVALEGIDRFYQ